MKNNSFFLAVIFCVASFGYLSYIAQAEEAQEPFVYQDKNNRDPFWPLINDNGVLQNYEKEYLVSDLELEGIMASPNGKSVAILNGKVVKVNDVVGEYTVKDIQANKVIILKGQEEFELQLKKGE